MLQLVVTILFSNMYKCNNVLLQFFPILRCFKEIFFVFCRMFRIIIKDNSQMQLKEKAIRRQCQIQTQHSNKIEAINRC